MSPISSSASSFSAVLLALLCCSAPTGAGRLPSLAGPWLGDTPPHDWLSHVARTVFLYLFFHSFDCSRWRRLMSASSLADSTCHPGVTPHSCASCNTWCWTAWKDRGAHFARHLIPLVDLNYFFVSEVASDRRCCLATKACITSSPVADAGGQGGKQATYRHVNRSPSRMGGDQ